MGIQVFLDFVVFLVVQYGFFLFGFYVFGYDFYVQCVVQVYDGLGDFGGVGVVQYVLYKVVVDFQVVDWELVEVVQVGEVGIEVIYG